jgi:hypothetical protein
VKGHMKTFFPCMTNVIFIKTSRCPYRAFGRHYRVQWRLVVSQMCYSVTMCQKVKKEIDKKLSTSSQKVVKKVGWEGKKWF